jgi:hypothetical protein
MFIRPCYREKDGKRHAYWALVESYRTPQGPRQRVVSYIGALDDDEGAEVAGKPEAGDLFEERKAKSHRIEIDPDQVQVRRCRDFGGVWLGWQLVQRLGLDAFVNGAMERGREEVPWPLMAWVLVLSRLCDASSELYIAEHLYARSAMPDLLGVGEEKINDDRLYRALDELLPQKAALEVFLKEKLGTLFDLKYDLLRGIIVRTANRCASRWWSAAAGCRWAMRCLPATRRIPRPSSRSWARWKDGMGARTGSGCWTGAWYRRRTWRFCVRRGADTSWGLPGVS